MPEKDSSNTEYNNSILRENARRHVTNLMAARGIYLNNGFPGLLLENTFTVSQKEKLMQVPTYLGNPYFPYSYAPYPYYYYGSPYFPYGPSSYIYETKNVKYAECKLTLNMYYKELHKLAWTATAQGDIYNKEDVESNYFKAVEAIMERYPVKPLKEQKYIQ
jgi:hypothetical protein